MAKSYTLARKNADKHQLYQWAVQDASFEVTFSEEQYKKRTNRMPLVLREDFCGTALVSCRWAESHPKRRAIGLDLDVETLAWARENNLTTIGDAASRVDLRVHDVRSVTKPKADIVHAFNFSYYLLHPMSELISYFRFVRRSLAEDGIFILDCYGGWERELVQKERRKVKSPDGSFGFVWEHAEFNPIDNRAQCHIHFEFKKGKRWKKAFSYDFRLYSPAEVRDALMAAGFTGVEVLWDWEEEEDRSDYRPAHEVENRPGWIAYIVAEAGGGSTKPR